MLLLKNVWIRVLYICPQTIVPEENCPRVIDFRQLPQR